MIEKISNWAHGKMKTVRTGNFNPVKLICGLIFGSHDMYERSEAALVQQYGELDIRSPVFTFDFTDYYEKQMGRDLKRAFLSFRDLRSPTELSSIKIGTISLEGELREEAGSDLRVINLDPGYLTASALIMATTKDFAHRVPLQEGIYAHLELLFGKKEVRTLDWTYPDFRSRAYQDFFLEVLRVYLDQIRIIDRSL